MAHAGVPGSNWSGHVAFGASTLEAPATIEELQALLARSPRVHPVGTAHSFNDIADTDGIQVDLGRLPQDVEVDADRAIAWLPAAMRYGTAARILDDQGWAVHNLASLGHISVAGTVSTGTHGSGDANPTLSAMVAGVERVTADGDLEVVDAADPSFPGAVVSLGALGILTRVGVRIEPSFTVRQYVFDDIHHDRVEQEFDHIFSAAYSVSFFTTWSSSRLGQVWMKRRDGTDPSWTSHQWMGGHLADGPRHPLPGHDPVHCTEQGGVPGPWHERLAHFRLDFTPSSGDELQTEYLLPRDSAPEALRALGDVSAGIQPLVQVSEVRTMTADDLWLSGAYGRPTVGVHFTWRRTPDVLPLLPELDALFAHFEGRPHWGKLFSATRPLADRYPGFGDFAALVQGADPRGKFRNRFIDEVLDGV